jgi:hypothetical protein
MKRWEYMQERLFRGDAPSDTVKWLNKLGNEGWELCTVVENVAFFKRKPPPFVDQA